MMSILRWIFLLALEDEEIRTAVWEIVLSKEIVKHRPISANKAL